MSSSSITQNITALCEICNIEEGVIPRLSFDETVHDTSFGYLVPRVTGSISAIASMLIIFIILRSEARLSTIYHRIMFGMSVVDTLSSIAMALSTLPMPASMPYEKEFGFRWSGTRIGNKTTCDIQGTILIFGSVAMFTYNGMLCIYYACAIGFLMRERNIRRYAEPLFHMIPTGLGIFAALFQLLSRNTINPSSTLSWCAALNYPYECGYKPSCLIKGTAVTYSKGQKIFPFWAAILATFVVLSFGFIIFRAIRIDRQLAEIMPSQTGSSSSNTPNPIEELASSSQLSPNHNMSPPTSSNSPPELSDEASTMIVEEVTSKRQHTKVIIKQAFGYILAFSLSFVFPLLRKPRGTYEPSTDLLLAKLTLIFYPLQGLFNFVIFCSHKIYNYRTVNPRESRWRVFRMLFGSRFHEPLFISRITIVERDREVDSEANHELEIQVMDESDGTKTYRLNRFGNVTSKHHQKNEDEQDIHDEGQSRDIDSLPSHLSRSEQSHSAVGTLSLAGISEGNEPSEKNDLSGFGSILHSLSEGISFASKDHDASTVKG